MTVAAALAGAAALLGARLDAELLLAHVLDVPRSAVIARDERILTINQIEAFERLVARRQAGEPLAYLLGTKEFWSLELEVTPDVLVPRPETELIVEWVLSSSQVLPTSRRASCAILDIGTGSGALALALAKELPGAHVVGTDISDAALAVAIRNSNRLKIPVTFRHADVFLYPELGGGSTVPDYYAPKDDRYDLIVSNPPYIAAGDSHLAALQYEPQLALTDDADGLSILKRIIGGAPRHLVPHAWCIVEHGHDQGPAVRKLFEAAGFDGIETRRDLAGHERATGGRIP